MKKLRSKVSLIILIVVLIFLFVLQRNPITINSSSLINAIKDSAIVEKIIDVSSSLSKDLQQKITTLITGKEKANIIVDEKAPTTLPVTTDTSLTELTAVTLVSVVDGDTLKVMDQENKIYKIRLIGIDTPESVHADKEKNNKYGTMASDYTKSLLTNITTLYLEYDDEHFDKYGRLLAYVWIDKKIELKGIPNAEELMLNAILVNDGYAIDKEYRPNIRYAIILKALTLSAKYQKKGLWNYSDCVRLWEGE